MQDNDGIADVRQISERELIIRKTKIFLTACEPRELQEALSGIYMGALTPLCGGTPCARLC